jgi:hypothetical protein
MKAQTHKRLLIGASSPVGYFYLRAGEFGRPAPILEAPLSYTLLYDEIWFLSRKLCPYNMEYLDFVHFVDEDLCREGLPKDAFKDIHKPDFGKFPWEEWNAIIANTIGHRWNYDNHATGLQFGELSLLPTPGQYVNLLIDRHIATTYDMDLVENSANAIWSRQVDENDLELDVSEKLLTSSVTSLQSIDGPWHPCIADLRSDRLLKEYRKKMQTVSIDDIRDIDQRVDELSKEFEKITQHIVQEHFETTGLFKSSAMFLLGLVPYVGNVIGAGGLLKEIHDKIKARKEKGWVGFLGKAQHTLNEGLSMRCS